MRILEVSLDRATELYQPWQLSRLDALGARRVERAAVGDVDLACRRLEACAPDERRHVAEPHRAHLAAVHESPGLEPPGRHVDDDPLLALAPLDHALVECPGDECDRAMAARGRVAGVVEEDDAEIRAVVVRLADEAAVHVRVAARLVDE